MHKKIVNKRRKKNQLHRCQYKQSSKSLRLYFYVVLQPATLSNMNELKAIPHRFSPLVPEQLLCRAVPFQSNFQIIYQISYFSNSYFSEQLLSRTAILYITYLKDFSKQLVFSDSTDVYFHLYSPVLNKTEHKKPSILICKQNHI